MKRYNLFTFITKVIESCLSWTLRVILPLGLLFRTKLLELRLRVDSHVRNVLRAWYCVISR